MIKFIIISPAFGHQSCELADGKYSVGRGMENSLVVCDHSVSTRHAELLLHGREVIVREKGSTNGTFVNGARVRGQSGIYHGQIMCFGRVAFLVEIERPSESELGCETAIDEFQRYFRQSQKPASAPSFPIVFRPIVRALMWEQRSRSAETVQ